MTYLTMEDIDTEIQWRKIRDRMTSLFGEVNDAKDVIFLVGLQELGGGYRKLSKDEKINVMHVGLCTVLSQFGYYTYVGHDKDGWPHWENTEPLPRLSEKENEHLLKQALVEYFTEKGVI